MTPMTPTFTETDIDLLANATGRVAVFITPDGKLDTGARRVNRLTKGALQRFIDSEKFEKLGEGKVMALSFPTGMAADAIDVVKLARNASMELCRNCLLYTSPSPRDLSTSRMPSSA